MAFKRSYDKQNLTLVIISLRGLTESPQKDIMRYVSVHNKINKKNWCQAKAQIRLDICPV